MVINMDLKNLNKYQQLFYNYHDIQFIYNCDKYSMGLCNKKRGQAKYYFSNRYSNLTFDSLQDLLRVNIGDSILEDIIDEIEIIETF